MATETGTFLHVHDIAAKLNTFAVANGWVQDKITVGGGTAGSANADLYLHKGTAYFSLSFRWSSAATRDYRGVSQSIDLPFVLGYGNTGFNTANAVDNQPGSSRQQSNIVYALSRWWFGPGRYWFFTNVTGDYIHCIVTKDTVPGDGDYQHLVFGTAETLSGPADDGRYIDASLWDQTASEFKNENSGLHSVIFDGTSTLTQTCGTMRATNTSGEPWKRIKEALTFSEDPWNQMAGGIRGDGIFMELAKSIGPSGLYRTTLVFPIILCPGLNVGASFNAISWPPGFKVVDVKSISMKAVAPEQIINDGVDDWQVFPAQRKVNDRIIGGDYATSGYVGLAYKVI